MKNIYAVVNNDQSNVFYDFTDEFKNGGYVSYLEKLKHYMEIILPNKKFTSIIEDDTYLFGLL